MESLFVVMKEVKDGYQTWLQMIEVMSWRMTEDCSQYDGHCTSYIIQGSAERVSARYLFGRRSSIVVVMEASLSRVGGLFSTTV